MVDIKFIIGVIVVFVLNLQARAEEVSGTMMVVKGDIKVIVAKGSTEEAGKVGKKVFAGDTIVAGADSRAKIVMSDKNVINISPDSKVVIEKYQNDGQVKNVELNVVYGKIRASVEQKYDGEKNKFNVRTASAVAGVRGTDFIAGYNRATRASQVITFSGTVAVGKPGPGGAILNPVFVQPGQITNIGEGKAPEPPKPMPKEEFNKMNNETKAETAKVNQGGESDKAKSDKSDKKSDGDKKAEGDKKADNRDDKKAEGDKKSDRQPANEPKEAKSDSTSKGDSAGGPGSATNSEPSRGPASTMEGGGTAANPNPNAVQNGDMMPGSSGMGPSMIGAAEMGPAAGSHIGPVLGGPAMPPPPQTYFPPPMNSYLQPTNPFLTDIIQNKNATVQIRIIAPTK